MRSEDAWEGEGYDDRSRCSEDESDKEGPQECAAGVLNPTNGIVVRGQSWQEGGSHGIREHEHPERDTGRDSERGGLLRICERSEG